MRLDFHKLEEHLAQRLLPVYLVAGDEPFQCIEALDLIRAAARKCGHLEREIVEHDARFDWQNLAASANARSLFGDKRLVELRLASAKIGNEGSNAIASWLQRPPPDVILLIASPKLERAQTSPKWVQMVEKHGVLLNIWPIEPRQLASWLEQRLKKRKLQPDAGVANWLTDRVEGNLLAGVQEIEKLLLLQGPGPLSLDQAIDAVSDSARYSVFELADSAVDGNSSRCLKILRALHDDGTESVLVLWALVKETRLLAKLAAQARAGASIYQVVESKREIRERRRPSYIKAVSRIPIQRWQQLLVKCAVADKAIKGMGAENPWVLFEQIALEITGVVVFKNS